VAPLAKILLDAFGIRKLLFTTIHSYTNQHRLADVPAQDMRRGRAAAENIIPQDSRSPGMLQELIPALRGKVLGSAMNVPVPNGSAVDLVCWHERPVTVTAINEVVRTAIAAQRRGIMAYETEPIVSSDVAHSSFSSTFDSRATMVLGENVSKTLSWYDAGWGYAHRVVELLERLQSLDREASR
jgi:glyceraldehyde 3-phosphate dehydrogenase